MNNCRYKASLLRNPHNLPPGISVNDFCFMHSTNYEKVCGKKQKFNADNDVDLYVAVKSKKKKIYLKYYSLSIPGGDLQLSYANMCRLGLFMTDDHEVTVKKAGKYSFLWYNWNAAVRIPVRCTIVFGIISIIGILPSVCNAINQIINIFTTQTN